MSFIVIIIFIENALKKLLVKVEIDINYKFRFVELAAHLN